MLNIPSLILNLFKRGVSHKNLRIHFPNGEYPDITNQNIVSESLKYSESLCSQDQFRFGLAEASVLEFETVGVGNMYGMTIEAYIEIDTSSLSNAFIATIEANPGDGKIVREAVSDLGYGYYQVPLGTFRVESCPRNHETMAHRQVTAYSYASDSTELLLSPYVVWKYSKSYSRSDVRTYESMKDFALSNLAWADISVMPYTKANVPQPSTTSTCNPYMFPKPDNSSAVITNATVTYYAHISPQDLQYRDKIYGITVPNPVDFESIVSALETELGGQYGSSTERLRRIVCPSLLSLPDMPDQNYPNTAFPVGDGIPAVYASLSDDFLLYVPESVSLTYTKNGTTKTFNLALWQTYPVHVFEWSSYPKTGEMSVLSTGSRDNLPNTTAVTGKVYSYVDALDLFEFAEGYVELQGEYLRVSRARGAELFALPSVEDFNFNGAWNFETCWWDEYDVSPIDSVSVPYMDDNKQSVGTISLGTGGASTYDLTSNKALEIAKIADLDDIASLLSGNFATNAANVGFTPVDMSMPWIPSMEAGDRIEVVLPGGVRFHTYALRIELTGIQKLTAVISAKGGTIIGEV